MKKVFFSEYVRNVRTVGAILPSSQYLAKKMIAHINFSSADVIVEYGPGTGVFTEQIIARKHASTALVIIEHNMAFAKILQEKYGDIENVFIEHDSAEHVEKHLKKHSLKKADYIVSGLPFAALPPHMSKNILEATVRCLAAKGQFATFQYTKLKKNFMHGYFKNIVITREFRNIPPAYIFLCSK